MMPVSLEESELISNEIESLQNNELKDSLMKLGKNIVKERLNNDEEFQFIYSFVDVSYNTKFKSC